MIDLTNIAFWYKKDKPVFSGLDLNLQKGAIYGLLGKNGAGKTTLLKIISGLLFPKQGTCHVINHKPGQRLPSFLSEVYYVPEELYIPSVKIKEFVNTYAPFYPRFDQARFDKYLDVFEISAENKMDALSYGQKKKAILAFGLASNVQLLILDEPTNGLDIPSKSQFRKVLTDAVSDEVTVIISTHQVRDLASLMDPIIIIENGKVLLQMSIEEIARKYQFQLVPSLKAPKDALYAEPVPGGYLTINHNEEGKHTEVDIEAFFNAIVSKTPGLV
ncbi:MAG: ABC transporter ATP-binding protein [Saprospiraceae bacterium]